MHILVTGGAGFIGSHTCVELLESGYSLSVLDDFENAEPSALDAIREITGKEVSCFPVDLKDETAVDAVFSENNFDGVIHFAGFKSVAESVQHPLDYYKNNVTGTVHLLKAMEMHGCRTIVFSSSACVYGAENPIPYEETMPLNAVNPYGWCKIMIEQMLKDLCVSDARWSALSLRYFNPIGAHASGLLGENPRGTPNNLLPYISKVAVGELPYLRVFGDDYPTPDGTGVRDYVHVCDLASGHVAALKYAFAHRGYEAVNLGTGHGSSVREVLYAYARACGRDLPYRILPRRAGDLAIYYADTSKAHRLLGWVAMRTLDEMCRDSWQFAKRQTR